MGHNGILEPGIAHVMLLCIAHCVSKVQSCQIRFVHRALEPALIGHSSSTWSIAPPLICGASASVQVQKPRQLTVIEEAAGKPCILLTQPDWYNLLTPADMRRLGTKLTSGHKKMCPFMTSWQHTAQEALPDKVKKNSAALQHVRASVGMIGSSALQPNLARLRQQPAWHGLHQPCTYCVPALPPCRYFLLGRTARQLVPSAEWAQRDALA